MIKADQPTFFKSNVIVALSSVQDGNMSYDRGDDVNAVQENRRRFLSSQMIAMQASVLCKVTYDRTDFTQYRVVDSFDRGKGMTPDNEMVVADALLTDDKACALFLPLADCVGAVFYDTARQSRLMLAHLGRHSVEQMGAQKCVEFMQDKFGTKPTDLLVWLGPAPNGEAYPIHARDGMSFHEVIVDDLQRAGVTKDQIELSTVDTVTDKNYFSHSEFLKGNRETDGRYAITVKMR